MHVTKFTQGACGHMINHYEREEGDGVIRSNEEIVPDLTHLNYNLAAEDQPKAGYQYLSERLEEVHHINRKDIIVMADWVITAPEEIKSDPEKCRQFFKCSYIFMKQKYSKESIISAWVHMDESTPHLHFAFMPIVKDEKHGGMKLGAKQLINRVELKEIHNQLQKKIDKELPFECKVLNGATKLGNRSVDELKEVNKQADTIVAQAEASASQTIIEAKEQAKAITETANQKAKETTIIAQKEASELIHRAKEESTFWKRRYHALADWVEHHLDKVATTVFAKWWGWDREMVQDSLDDIKEAWNMSDEELSQILGKDTSLEDDFEL